MDNVNVPNYPGSIKIEEIWHSNGTDKTDITNIVMHIDINSDIEITSSFCEFAIVDYNNWMEKRQFGAGDVITFSSSQMGTQFERRYRIKSISSIVNLENGKAYTLKCISDFEYMSIHERISKSYFGKASDIAKVIVNEKAKEPTGKWEESSQIISFIAPSWSPMQCVQYLANRASNIDSTTRFYAFQDSKQLYNFISIPKLKELYGKNVQTYRYFQNTNSKNGIPDTGKMISTIKDITFLPAFDIYKATQTGNIKNTFQDLDINTKSLSIQTNSYWDTYSKNNLNKNNMWKSEETGPANIINRFFPSSVNIYPPYSTGSAEDSFKLSRGQQIEIIISGNNSVDIGQILNIEIPNMEPDSKGELDKVWSGQYYVTSKRDSIDVTGHTIALRLVKDSFMEGR